MTYSNIRKNIITSIAIGVAFVLAITVNPLSAQVFPVQANINVTPPYTVYLSHYTAPDQQRVMASVLLHDPVVTSLDVRFRFTIEGAGIRIYTNPGWIPAPFTLRSGITELISADIIAEYFRPQNVIAEGINPQELFRKGKLPEGFYQFKIEVLEYQRGVPISNIGRTGVWLLLSEPPRVVFPTPNQKVNATNPQILNFTWVPGGVTSPLSVISTMYEFTLVELMGDVDPTVAITTASDAIKFTRTQQQTTLLYGPGEPQLIPGKRYAYRVRAYNTDGYELFKNNGYSEVRVFQFGDACNVPTMFSLTDETQSTFNIDVVSDPSSTAWQAQFRESGDEAGQWSELKAEPGTSTKTVKGLKASTTYQVQLKSLCGTVSSSYTTPQTITTKEKVNTQRSCENSVSPFVVSQAQPLQQLKPNDVFLAALMPIKVTEVTSQGGGKFSGKGIATVPLFSAGLAVHFTDIGINELMQLTAGEVVVERNAVNITLLGDTDPTGNGSTTGNGTATDTTGNDGWPEFTDTINISSDIDSVVVVNDTTVWVYTSGGGEPVIVDMGGSDCLLIVPADGNMDNAQVVYNGAAKPYSAGNGSTSDTDEQYTGFRARFAPALNTHYGFDSLRIQTYANYYNDLEIDGKTYKLPWKALPVNIPDPVMLHIRRSAGSYPYSDLKVGVLGGNDLLPAAGANTATQTYNLTGTNDGDQYAVVAKYTQEGKSKYVGGLWAATYQKKEHKLYIVPLPGVEVPAATIGQLQNGLTQIYSQAVVSWTVQPLNGFTGVELGDNGLDWADKDMLSSYNAEMNSVISEFKNWKTDADPDAYYLFVVPKFSESGVEGFMPRNRRFGFVTLSQLDARLVAHEIGHGAFNLRHTFPEVPQGSTDNLMDYSEGNTALLKPQWDLIHNPETTTGLFDEMEDGASKNSYQAIIEVIEKIRCGYVSKRPINISKSNFDFKTNVIENCRCFNDNYEYKYFNLFFDGEVKSYKLPNTLPIPTETLTNKLRYKLGNIYIVIHKDDKFAFENYIYPKDENNYANECRQAINTLSGNTLTKQQKINKLINFSQCIYENLTVEQRQVILYWIAGDNSTDITENIEDVIINVLRTVQDSKDARKLIDFIAQKNLMSNFTHLTKGMSDVGGKPNYTRFVLELFRLYRMAFDNELKDKFSTDAFGNLVSLNGDVTSFGSFSLVKYPILFNWNSNNGTKLSAQGNTIDLFSLKALGEIINYNYSSNTSYIPVGAFDVVIVKFNRDIFLLNKEDKGVDRVMAMPAFVLQWLCLRELKKDIAEFVNTAVTLTSAISSFGSLVFLTRSIGIGSRLWVAQQRLTQLIALKNTISVFLLSKDCEEWIKKGGWVGVNFVEAFKNIDTILNLGGESALKAILKMDFVDQVIVLVAGWEAIKLRPDVGRYFDEKNLTKMDSYVKELVNLRKQINGEVGGEVE